MTSTPIGRYHLRRADQARLTKGLKIPEPVARRLGSVMVPSPVRFDEHDPLDQTRQRL
jgi:hypothetical protein